jgi:hypothetical protein
MKSPLTLPAKKRAFCAKASLQIIAALQCPSDSQDANDLNSIRNNEAIENHVAADTEGDTGDTARNESKTPASWAHQAIFTMRG